MGRYTNQTLMERRFSQIGITEYADLDNNGVADTGVVDDSIDWGESELDLWLGMRYDVVNLATIVQAGTVSGGMLVRRWATEFSCMRLCTVRGLDPPGSLVQFYEELTKERTGYLWKLMRGYMQLPGIPVKGDLRPTVSNLTVDRRFRSSKIRVTGANSTDAPTKLSQDNIIDQPTLWD